MGGSKRVGSKNSATPAAAPSAAPAAQEADAKDKPRHTCLHSQLHKTKFCLYHLKGACQFGANCSFAHSCAELQATPDLRKTRLCMNFFEGSGCNDPDCTFAHCEEDLRSTDMFYKKTLCIWNEKGKCRNGDQCRFAHGLVELRANQGTMPGQQGLKDKEGIDGVNMGRQLSSTSGTTATSCGNASTVGSLSSYDSAASGSTGAASGRTRGRARGKRGGAAPAGQQPTAPAPSTAPVHPSSGDGDAMPMKIMPGRSLAQPSMEEVSAVPASSRAAASFHQDPQYDPVLQAELHKLRCSVSALAQRCNEINHQMYSEALKTEKGKLNDKMYTQAAMLSQAALRQQLMQQARQEQGNAALLQMASRLGAANRYVPPPFPHQNGVDWAFGPDLSAGRPGAARMSAA